MDKSENRAAPKWPERRRRAA